MNLDLPSLVAASKASLKDLFFPGITLASSLFFAELNILSAAYIFLVASVLAFAAFAAAFLFLDSLPSKILPVFLVFSLAL
jgi:hypothetical protein